MREISLTDSSMLTGLLSHFTSLSSADILTAVYLVLLISFVVVCNLLFESFVDSKPEGRKTVLGKKRVPNKSGHFS